MRGGSVRRLGVRVTLTLTEKEFRAMVMVLGPGWNQPVTDEERRIAGNIATRLAMYEQEGQQRDQDR